jgi:asparagine synthase (glutamine-hydrolysing)
MCGISGEFRFDQRNADLTVIQRMLNALQARGPDQSGTYAEGALAFGHRRLSIIDLSHQAHQPMVDRELGLVLVFNGTIYNYRTLRKRLQSKGYRFFSQGDSEVILKAFHAWGMECVQHFEGMFAFSIWDTRNRCLYLCRDRLGIKPLYYSRDAQRLRFASNTQALLSGGDINTEIDPVALQHHMSLHAVVPAPRTILKGIRKLPPACWLKVDAQGEMTIENYWQLKAERPATPLSEDEWLEQIHAALRAAVKKRAQAADVPVGVLLSGGLDSSLLVALLDEISDDKILTFSVGFEDQPEEKGSEFEYSDQVVERYQTEHYKYQIANDQVLKRLPEAVDAMAEPMVAQDAVAFYLLAEQVSQEVKVVQSGQGADEVFAGYFWYPEMYKAEEKGYLDRFRHRYFDRSHAEFLTAVQPPYRGADFAGASIAGLLAKPHADDFLDRVLRTDVTTLIVDDPVKRVDNMTMAWGLEARVPFLDHHLVELAAQMPPELKLREQGKYPLKAIARTLLPASVIDRPKGYFPVPALKYVRGEFLEFMRDVLHSDTCRQRGLYETAYVEKLLAAPEKHLTAIQGSKLWHLTLLEFWLQRHGI